jgi:hypothetical protein
MSDECKCTLRERLVGDGCPACNPELAGELAEPAGSALFAFEVSVKGTDWTQIVNARTPGKAKKVYHRQVTEAWPDVPFTAMRCRKIGRPHTSERFRQNARYRGMPDVECGQRVRVGKSRGVIVGHNESANFNVLFDDEDARYPGLTLNVHPSEVEIDGPNSKINASGSPA